MIEEQALILSVKGDFAEVQVQRQNSCGSCSAKAGCGSALLSSVFGNKRNSLQVYNPIQAGPGERVVIGLNESPFLKAAFTLYALPLLLMIVGALFGEWLALQAAADNTEPAALSGGLLGLLTGLAWVRRFSRRCSEDARYQAKVLRRAPGVSVHLA